MAPSIRYQCIICSSLLNQYGTAHVHCWRFTSRASFMSVLFISICTYLCIISFLVFALIRKRLYSWVDSWKKKKNLHSVSLFSQPKHCSLCVWDNHKQRRERKSWSLLYTSGSLFCLSYVTRQRYSTNNVSF